jgi:hypothetical protein
MSNPIGNIGGGPVFNQPETPKPAGSTSGGFRRVLGGIAGAAANLFVPGLGGVLGNWIGSGASRTGAMSGDATQYLQLQMQMQAESRAFETMSTILKSRHDAAMSAIRNIK